MGTRTLGSTYQKAIYFVAAFFIALVLPVIAISKKFLFFQNNDDIFILGRVSGIFMENQYRN
jgi:hypothetical protein